MNSKNIEIVKAITKNNFSFIIKKRCELSENHVAVKGKRFIAIEIQVIVENFKTGLRRTKKCQKIIIPLYRNNIIPSGV